MVMKTVARGRSEEIHIQIFCSLKKKKTDEKGKGKTRNKLCTRLKALACALVCAGYNREGSKEAADILLRHVCTGRCKPYVTDQSSLFHLEYALSLEAFALRLDQGVWW